MLNFRRTFNLPKKITIEWSYPQKVDTVLLSPTSKDENWGLYQISTKTESGTVFLYIGKSWKDYHKRLKSHRSKWFDKYEGEKYVRFGSFNKLITEKQLDEVESAIIFQTLFLQNKQCTLTYNVRHDYEISSIGNRGKVPSQIMTKKH